MYNFVASGFNLIAGSDTHVSTDWEVYQGATLVKSNYNDVVNLTSWEVDLGTLPLASLTVRVRYKTGKGVVSDWSTVRAFDIVEIGIGTVLSDGYIVYDGNDTEWYAVAPQNQRVFADMWIDYDPDTYVMEFLGASSTSDGYANTLTMLPNSVYNDFPARFAWDSSRSPIEGGTGSYLPSIGELAVVYQERVLINSADTTGNLYDEPVGGYPFNYYDFIWSSTEISDVYASVLTTNGNNMDVDKAPYDHFWVVPIRRFPK